jgi:hypothetical protein
MPPDELIEVAYSKPFAPFRLELSDGTNHDLHQPGLCMVGKSFVIVGITSNRKSSIAQKMSKLDLRNVAAAYHLPYIQEEAASTS